MALLRTLPGYAGGLAVGTLYFTGFTGIFLVLSVHLQDARGLSALETGLPAHAVRARRGRDRTRSRAAGVDASTAG